MQKCHSKTPPETNKRASIHQRYSQHRVFLYQPSQEILGAPQLSFLPGDPQDIGDNSRRWNQEDALLQSHVRLERGIQKTRLFVLWKVLSQRGVYTGREKLSGHTPHRERREAREHSFSPLEGRSEGKPGAHTWSPHLQHSKLHF